MAHMCSLPGQPVAACEALCFISAVHSPFTLSQRLPKVSYTTNNNKRTDIVCMTKTPEFRSD